VLLASPVYRASFTGALKNLLDLTPVEALRAKPVGIVAMGATLHHYLGVHWQLRAVLAWFGALVVPTSVYLESGHFQDGKLADPAARAGLGDLVGALVAMAAHPRDQAGPPPLAAGRDWRDERRRGSGGERTGAERQLEPALLRDHASDNLRTRQDRVFPHTGNRADDQHHR
jgi:hypothetical protein